MASAKYDKESNVLPEMVVPAVEQRSNEKSDKDTRLNKMESAVVSIIDAIGENPFRDGLLKTPRRAAEAFNFFTKGYEESLEGNTIS